MISKISQPLAVYYSWLDLRLTSHIPKSTFALVRERLRGSFRLESSGVEGLALVGETGVSKSGITLGPGRW